MVREWDPGTASAAEIEAVLRALNEIVAFDVPEDPPWRDVKFREYLAVTMPGERRTSWLAVDDSGAHVPAPSRGERRGVRVRKQRRLSAVVQEIGGHERDDTGDSDRSTCAGSLRRGNRGHSCR
jgi:hypothetical protein